MQNKTISCKKHIILECYLWKKVNKEWRKKSNRLKKGGSFQNNADSMQ